ncbi:MAG: CfrBI family restriction endonuclease [Candidatus Lokiarchaeota archaeon]|nr:CfrBI family restriction endonuclease [Candidatus Lokiarchaeota archaeon]
MTLTEKVAKNIIRKLLKGEDYRIEIVTLINAEFLQYSIDFFKKIVDAKLRNENITTDWYKKEFLSEDLSADEIAINAGLNKKTISNMYNSARREIVIEASKIHYEQLYEAIKTLVDDDEQFNITLMIKFKSVSVDLNVSESLIVINTLAVKRAALRGGLWSTAGKRVEKPLMETLCKLFGVPGNNYKIIPKGKNKGDIVTFEREVDFYLNHNNEHFKCEVKLMGKGNPESADAVIARDSRVFVADKLSATNKNQLDSLNVEWVEFRDYNGYMRFKRVLDNLQIPYSKSGTFTESELEKIFDEIF